MASGCPFCATIIAILLVVAACIIGASPAVAAGRLGSYSVNEKLISTSGISSGGFFAVQFHVAFSSQVMGTAFFASGPYYCAQGQIMNALTTCMSSPSSDISVLTHAAENFAAQGKIDPLTNLKGAPVFVYSGSKDSVVNQGVVKNGAHWYENFHANVQETYNVPSQHCIPTDNFGNSCSYLGKPYINNCQYDGAEAALKWIYSGYLKSPGVRPVSENLLQYDQREFGSSSDGFGDTGYIYVPTTCQKGATCALHIAFHGCEQTLSDIGTDYVLHTGFLELAEANGIILLFPQVHSSPLKNPKGCYDWWGYTNADYAFKNGPQMAAVQKMMLRVMGKGK